VVAVALARAHAADIAELVKPRISALVMVTVAAGYYLAAPPAASALALLHALVGTALVASAASALNQVAERDVDAMMRRTAARPLPAGRLSPLAAATFAWSTGLAGLAYLAAFSTPTTMALAAATLLSYVYLYTPLKRRTALATLVGAIPGALPVVGGWAAAGAELDVRAWVLFWVLFLWQLPHFLAVSWIYREDYARAGLRMLCVNDADGRSTFQQAALGAGALLPVSLTPTLVGLAGQVYFVAAVLLSGWLVWVGVDAARRRSVPAARRLFRASLVYLPLLLTVMVLDRAT